MRIVAKKVIIYSMLGLMQVGMFSSIAAAAPGSLHNDNPQRIVQLDRHDRHDRDRHERDRRREHDERLRREHERHEQEMRRRPFESRREWHERQRRENERHNRELHEIGAFLLGLVIGRASND
ncbi:hypothetical protein [Sporomusa sp.]|uniref:hypothetical protein n=1 Tax=Sporomusa sp. TaxID=2078658 RepID=UPI002C88C90B|nr:hypothetical protein [Sporomusa sp.]HWR06682.1 hypothetical protein [Sporomusa sp.]